MDEHRLLWVASDVLAHQASLVVLDASVGPRQRRVLLGAHRVDLEVDLSRPVDPAVGGRHPLPPLRDWCETLGRWGVGPQTTVVIYDNRGGGLAAARAWWMLRAVGHQRVGLLDGGLAAAQAAGLTTADTGPPQLPSRPYPANRWVWPMANANDVDLRRGDLGWRVIDARSAERFRGDVEPIDPVAGCIEGAVNLPWADCVDGGFLRPRSELEALVEGVLGDVPADRVITHCGSGVTACHTLFVLELLGRGQGSLYVGSWSEWCRR